MLKLPSQSLRVATAAVVEEREVKKILAPITGQPNPVDRRGDLVPLTTSLKAVVAQVGTYSSLHISATTTSLHPAGNLAARTALFKDDVAWILDAFDAHAKQWNEMRGALGMKGDWTPSGRSDDSQS